MNAGRAEGIEVGKLTVLLDAAKLAVCNESMIVATLTGARLGPGASVRT